MKYAIPALMLVPLAACATTPQPEYKLSAKEQKELAGALEGKVAGEPVSCVSAIGGRNLQAIGDSMLVYRVSSDLVYVNRLDGVCHGLSWGDTLVMRLYGTQYCRGDIAHVVNLPSGTLTGTCALGDFIPYRTAKTGKAKD